VLLTCAYVVLSFPYMYRAIDAGLRTLDIRTLTEASQSLGAGWVTIIVAGHPAEPPRVDPERGLPDAGHRRRRVHDRELPGQADCSPTYLQLISGNLAYEPAAVALISFGITWAAMGLIALIGRGSKAKVELTGAH